MNPAIRFFRYLWQDKGIALAGAWSFNQLAYAIVYPFIPIYLCQERGMEYALVSIIFPLLGLAVIFAPLPCGWITDRFGHNSMLISGQVLRGVIFFFLAACVYFKAPFYVFAASLMLNTAVGVAFQVGSDAYLANITTSAERPGYYSKIRIGFNVGWALGPMLGAFFSKTPFWIFFILTGILCLVGTLHTWLNCCRKNPVKLPEKTPKSNSSEPGISKQILHNPRFLWLMGGTLFLMLLASQLYSTMSIFSTSSVGITRKDLGTIYSLNGFMVLAFQMPLVALLTKLKVKVMPQILLGVLLYFAGYMQLGFAGGAIAIAIAVAVITFGEIIVQPALYTAVSSETKASNAGRMMSVSSLMRGIGYSVGPWIGGQLFDKASSPVLWSILSSFALISAVMFLVAERKKQLS